MRGSVGRCGVGRVGRGEGGERAASTEQVVLRTVERDREESIERQGAFNTMV